MIESIAIVNQFAFAKTNCTTCIHSPFGVATCVLSNFGRLARLDAHHAELCAVHTRMKSIVIHIIILICDIVKADYGGHDLFTSLTQLHDLWQNEGDMVKDMKVFLSSFSDIQSSFQR